MSVPTLTRKHCSFIGADAAPPKAAFPFLQHQPTATLTVDCICRPVCYRKRPYRRDHSVNSFAGLTPRPFCYSCFFLPSKTLLTLSLQDGKPNGRGLMAPDELVDGTNHTHNIAPARSRGTNNCISLTGVSVGTEQKPLCNSLPAVFALRFAKLFDIALPSYN